MEPTEKARFDPLGAFKQTAPKSHRHSWTKMIRRPSIGMLARGLKTALDA